MKVAVASLALLIATSWAAVTLPADLGDGVWAIDFDDDHNIVGEPKLLAPLNRTVTGRRGTATEHLPPTRRAPLPNPQTTCGPDQIDPGAFQCAQQEFDKAVGGGTNVGHNQLIQSTCGSSVAYMCNYANTQPAVNTEFDDATDLDNAQCGPEHAGWVYIPDWNKAYGRANAGAQICF